MNSRTLAPMAGLALALSIAGPANAAYVGLSSQLHTTVAINGGSYHVYRVYANFTSADDQLTVVSGSGVGGPMTILNLNNTGTGPGSGFFNSDFGGVLAPNPAFFPLVPELQWDTFVTIGMPTGPQPSPDQTALSPGFVTGLITGTGGTATDSAWFVTPDAPQSYAGADLSVMLAQLTVASGEYIAGTVNISGVSGGNSFTFNGQIFGPLPPTPGAVALFVVAGCFGGQRRRA